MVLLLRLLTLWLILFISISIAQWSGRTTPDPLSAFGLETCDGAPCFAGIIPGKTVWADVHAHLVNYHIFEDFPTKISAGIDGKFRAEIFRNSDMKTLVSLIDIYAIPPARLPTLGSFVLKYHEPCVMSLLSINCINQGGTFWLVWKANYPSMTLSLDSHEPIKATTGVEPIRFWDVTTINLCENRVVRWAGFASSSRYVAIYLGKLP
jgi:hypothetical protein